MRDTVIFDLGGVLIDWNPRHLFRNLFGDEQAMSWTALPGKTMHVQGSTAATVAEISRVEVLSASGRPVLRLDL